VHAQKVFITRNWRLLMLQIQNKLIWAWVAETSFILSYRVFHISMTRVVFVNKNMSRWVLSETKAIMSSLICHWMETIGFLHEDGIINWSYRRKWQIPIRCNKGKGIYLLKWKSELLNLVMGLSHTMFNLELWSWPWTDLGQIRISHRHIILDIGAKFFENSTRGSKDI